jgi:hypothetical protein
MSAVAAIPPVPDPVAPGDKPGRFGRLVDLVRKLIDYGKELAATLQQRTTSDLAPVTLPFGTGDIGLILARITRGLLRASALEARVVELAAAAHPDAPPKPPRAPAQRAPRAPQPAAVKPAGEANPRLARLPTPEQIAAEVRRRPVGAVIVDICRDLGITPSHPLWRELCRAVMLHGGSLVALFKDICDRVLPIRGRGRSAATPAALPAPAAAGTGPP